MRTITNHTSTPDIVRGTPGRGIRRASVACLLGALVSAGLLGCDPAAPPQTSPPQASSAQASPTGAGAGGTVAASPSAPPVGLTELPDAAFLVPADLGTGFRVLTDEPMGDGFEYSLDYCRRNGQWDGTPEGPSGSSMSAKTARQVVFAGPDSFLSLQWIWALPSVDQARQAMAHARAGFEHCAVVKLNGATDTFTILKSGFAGDESMLVRHGERHLLLFVRAGAAYASVDLARSFDAARAEALADLAVQRICDATPTC
ncbi:hypothetical protein [Catellatospora paridis]|uniref:hypothetical protein n=1 Tax=Catellatospora paridis TaxID=1617086 RepID=UPI0012D4B9B9|nr:hypothetical protein [Catellatospora paridis]